MQVELNRETILEASRFVIVGVIATALHYGIYWILMRWVNVNIAYTIGYALSFVCNFFLTSYFTFKAKATMKRGLGFGSAHLVNYLLQMAFLNLFIWLGIMAEWAPIPVYMIVIPINFLLVRFVFKKI
ncbi:MAG: GtrA family protein [Bacteroidaceae bacterium]|nr:GtrA family protein [Bacteroidaceae bacterium]